MNAHTAIWEPVTYAEMSYILTEDDVEDGKNKLGMDVSHIPLNVPLCISCDKPIHNDMCPSCEVVFIDCAPTEITRDIDPKSGNERVAA